MNSLTNQQTLDFIEKLIAKTSSGSIKWQLEPNSGVMSSTTNKFRYEIFSRDNDDYAPFFFNIYLRKPIETDEQILVGEAMSFEGGGFLNPILQALFHSAKLSLGGIKDLAAELSQDLED